MERRLTKTKDWLFETYLRHNEYYDLIFTPEGTILFINKILPGLDINNVIGSSIFKYVSENSLIIVQESINNALITSKHVVFEAVINPSPSINLNFSIRLRKETLDNDRLILRAILVDITMYKIVYKELLSLKNKLFKYNISKFDNYMLFRIISPDLTLKYFNKQFSEIFDVNNKDNSKIVVTKYLSPSLINRYKKHIKEIVESSSPRPIETVELNKQGIRVNCKWIDHPKIDNNGNVIEIYSYGTVTGLHSNSENTLILKAYNEILNNLPIGFIECDTSKLSTYFDRLKNSNIKSIEEYLENNNTEILKCASMIKITEINSKAIELLNIDSQKSTGQIQKFFYNETIIKLFKERLISSFNGQNYFESTCTKNSPNGRSLDYYVKFIIPKGYEKTKTKIYVFISEDKEKNKLKKEIEKQYNQLVHVDRMKSLGILVSGTAHEINNPNHVIMLNISLIKQFAYELINLLEDKKQNEQQIMGMPIKTFRTTVKDLLNGIEESSEKIKYIVSELKEYSIQNKNSIRKIEDINKIIRKSVKVTNSYIKNSTDNFELNLSDMPIQILADKIKLEQVFINVIENACQALTLKDQAIKIKVYTNFNNNVIVKIVDEGIGVARKNLDFIFNPFFTTKTEKDGTGLGLFISHNIIQNHNGSIEIDSEEKQGTTVKIILPIYQKTENENEFKL